MKLGRLPVKAHPRTLKLGKYIAPWMLPNPAAKVYREYKTPDEAKQMFGNDKYGDCTCAGAANLLITMTCHTGQVVIPTLQEVLDMYTAVSGFDQKTGENDNGAAMTDCLEHLRTEGLHGHKIRAWAAIDFTSLRIRRIAVDLFGATYVGVNFPESAEEEFGEGKNWETLGGPIIGGHAIIHPGYGAAGGDYVTWSKWDQKASAAWERSYIEEEYVVITDDWINQVTLKTPGGLDLETLEADLKLIGS